MTVFPQVINIEVWYPESMHMYSFTEYERTREQGGGGGSVLLSTSETLQLHGMVTS